ncbi:MAG: hypothetical protein JWM10_2376 [Myxococcaceae bacterium]|nr:hypothetical protein [Myxococcaceae bacterium]
MTSLSRVWIRLGASLLVVGAAAGVLHACSDSDAATGLLETPDAGAVTPSRQPCRVTANCEARNEVCVRTGAAEQGMCVPPTGTCDPEATIEGQCYPDARCDVSARRPDGQGSCSFQSPARAVFPAVEARILLDAPRPESELFPTSGFSFQWQPLRGVAGAVTVAMVTRAPPTFDPASGRISNRGDVVWAWSTAETGNTAEDTRAVDGTVPVRFGRAGLGRDGSFGPAWGRDSLDAGAYWWFVYAIVRGEVVATSVAQSFVVGAAPARPVSCDPDAGAGACVGPGELPELFECYQSQCRRRCASDLDCRAAGTSCRFEDTVIASAGVRRGAFCATVANPMTGDAGATGDGPR